MTDLRNATTAQLVNELNRRDALPCPCGKWRTYMGYWDRDSYTLRCEGCYKSVLKCTCGGPHGW